MGGKDPQTRRMNKNESGRVETARRAAALKAIRNHFGMEKATNCDVLMRLVDEGGLFVSSCGRFSKS